jgi:hypothetical protein
MNEEFWKEFESLLAKTSNIELEYRLYYNDVGEIHACTMQDHLDSTTYVVVTKDEYDRYFDYYVADNQLKKIDRTGVYTVQLRRSMSGYKTVANHASLIIEPDEKYNHIEYYERNN